VDPGLSDVLDFICHRHPEQRKILTYYHELLETLELKPLIKYRVPFYEHHSRICYLNPIKRNGVELAFIHGKELSNTSGLLEDKNRKQVAGIDLYCTKQFPDQSIVDIVKEAMVLDEFKKNYHRSRHVY
jgi:hypothetical protein